MMFCSLHCDTLSFLSFFFKVFMYRNSDEQNGTPNLVCQNITCTNISLANNISLQQN